MLSNLYRYVVILWLISCVVSTPSLSLFQRKAVLGSTFCFESVRINFLSSYFKVVLRRKSSRLFPIEAILKHKQVVCMRGKLPFTIRGQKIRDEIENYCLLR